MILEGIVTTIGPDGALNISPMGPEVDEEMTSFLLKPFNTSKSYLNLKVNGEGVIHVVDDVWLLARAAVGPVEAETIPAENVNGHILKDACRYFEFRVTEMDESEERIRIETKVVAQGRLKEFFGLNRAKHAVVEAAILATRTDFLPLDGILSDYQKLAVLVEKTGGEQERGAFEFLRVYVNEVASRRH